MAIDIHQSRPEKSVDDIPREELECLPVVVLIATTYRRHLHEARTVPSLLRQTRPWDMTVIVDDTDISLDELQEFWSQSGVSPVRVWKNNRTRGAAGTWNTGLDIIRKSYSDAWISILDDDDEWTDKHLEVCLSRARRGVDAVISGIVTYVDEVEASVPNQGQFVLEDFLYHNPGWQGSNTFVKLSSLERAGRFDEGLACTHDRDLAVRLLDLEGFRHMRTGEVTVKYHIGSNEAAYTRRLNPEKLEGLKVFWRKHRHRMTPEHQDKFFSRALEVFGFNRDQLTA